MTKNEFNEILSTNSVVIVKLSASWCGPCRAMEPIIKSVSEKMQGKANVMEIDVEESPNISTEYRVRNIPTILYFKDGELKDKSVGSISEDDLINRINNLN